MSEETKEEKKKKEEELKIIIEENAFFEKPVLFFFKSILEKKFFGSSIKDFNLKNFELSYDSKLFDTKKEYCIKVKKKNKEYYVYYYTNCEEKIIIIKTENNIFSRTFKFPNKKSVLVKVEKLLSKPIFLEEKSNNEKLCWVYNSKKFEIKEY